MPLHLGHCPLPGHSFSVFPSSFYLCLLSWVLLSPADEWVEMSWQIFQVQMTCSPHLCPHPKTIPRLQICCCGIVHCIDGTLWNVPPLREDQGPPVSFLSPWGCLSPALGRWPCVFLCASLSSPAGVRFLREGCFSRA